MAEIPQHGLEPAASVLRKCGGVAKVATWLELDRSSVLRWTHPKRVGGGTGGLIPAKHQLALLTVAQANGIALEAGDFITAPQAAVAA